MKIVDPGSLPPTLRAVAAHAGVSAMTVSRALGNRAGIAAGQPTGRVGNELPLRQIPLTDGWRV